MNRSAWRLIHLRGWSADAGVWNRVSVLFRIGNEKVVTESNQFWTGNEERVNSIELNGQTRNRSLLNINSNAHAD